MPDNLLAPGASGASVSMLHTALQQLGLNVPDSEVKQAAYGTGTTQAVQQFQKSNNLPITGQIDATTASTMASLTNVGVPAGTLAGNINKPPASGGSGGGGGGTTSGGGNTPSTVHGKLTFDNGMPAANIPVLVMRVVFGGQDTLLVRAVSDSNGAYQASYTATTPATAATQHLPPASNSVNLQIRSLDSAGKETILSATRYNVSTNETFNLIVPAGLQAMETEFQRLANDLQVTIGGIANLAAAKESPQAGQQRDLSLLRQTTKWDARLTALAATAVQQSAVTGMSQDAMYALLRVGLPSTPELLAQVPVATVEKALNKANQAGVVKLNIDQIQIATTAFRSFAGKTQLTLKAPGMVSSIGTLLTTFLPDTTQQQAFTQLFLANPDGGAALWEQAANQLKIPAATLDQLKLQGKFLHLTQNNALLASHLQTQIGSINNLSQLADQDYHDSATWTNTLNKLATDNKIKIDQLIPGSYVGNTTADRLNAYSADMARKVRLSFPTQVTARMIDKNQITLPPAQAGKVSSFLRSATQQGYELGRTPLNQFLAQPGSPKIDADGTASLKTLHRLYQVTPSNESLQVALKQGFSSAYDIAANSWEDFKNKFGAAYPSFVEAGLVYRKAQQITTVTFNAFTMAKQMDSAPPVYALSSSSTDKQNAKNALVQQFPSMASMFGSLDFCQCEDCRSVLSPAAYFVDLLEYLRQSTANAAGYTPLDVLIGKDNTVPGRRPDLAALPLTCENTNTALPYIDIVNEILEYSIANGKLDSGVAYDTGSATSAQLTAEPQHTLPQVYNTILQQALYPLQLPFDLWLETVRGFLNYTKTPLVDLLTDLSPVDSLELFTDANNYPWYSAQILAESLNISPSEYNLFTVTNAVNHQPSVSNWFALYGYADENTALNGQPDPINIGSYLVPPCHVAKNLSIRLGLTYQELSDVVMTGFFNPFLYKLIYQFKRYGISSDDAFSYTNQAGFPALTAQQKSDFETQLQVITDRYKKTNPASTFDAKAWLVSVLPTNYSSHVLVLYDPDTGCNFSGTSLQYADGTATTALDFLKLNLFVRLWKKTGWVLDEIDRALQCFFPAAALPAWSAPSFAAAYSQHWQTALVYFAHLQKLNTLMTPVMGLNALLPLWQNLPTQGLTEGTLPLYQQLFMTSGVLNSDWAFDDPSGQFPWNSTDTLAQHQSTVQGVLSLSSDDITAILTDAGLVPATAVFTLANLSLCYRTSLLAQCLQLSVTDLIAFKALTGLNPFPVIPGATLVHAADDLLQTQTLAFVQQVFAVQNSGFTITDLQYLLRQNIDPASYVPDPNAIMTLLQTLMTGFQQIQTQNAVPANLSNLPDSQVDQLLSKLFPVALPKSLLTLLGNAQSFSASQGGVAVAIDPTPFAAEPQLSFSYNAATQTQTIQYQGLLTDGKKTQLQAINNTAVFAGLLTSIQQQLDGMLAQRIADILAVWASLTQYQTVKTPVLAALPSAPLQAVDPALSLAYDQSTQLQWVSYRGVLTKTARTALEAVNNSADLSTMLNAISQQTLADYSSLFGTILAMLTNVQSFDASQTGVLPANALNSTLFAAWPTLQLSYDAASNTQHLHYQGVLSASDSAAIAAVAPTSASLPVLLASVRNQAVQLFQHLAGNDLTVTAADVDTFSAPLQNLTATAMQKQVKAELISVFLPLQAQKLTRQLVLQTLSSNLSADANLTEALVTDVALLTDPSNPGTALLGTFLNAAQTGVTASWYASNNLTGPVLKQTTAASVDSTDVSNPGGAASARFEAYLQLPSDGIVQFFAELGNTNAQLMLHLDAPDSTVLFSNPILQYTASKNGDEARQFVNLKGGIAYHFIVEIQSLGAQGASLLIQGENLPKGTLSRALLYPQQNVTAFTRAQLLLSKVIQILRMTGLGVREISYLLANANQFGNIHLAALPTQPSDDTLVKAQALYKWFAVLLDYAGLRANAAGHTDGLINVMNNVGITYTESTAGFDSNLNSSTPWAALANVTRRDVATVRSLARYFGFLKEIVNGTTRSVTAQGDFANNRGLRRMWQAMHIQNVIGVPVEALTIATNIVSLTPPPSAPTPDVISDQFKNALMARYTNTAWLPIAQSIFDKLRQKKRNALVAYLINQLSLDSENQLFEYFLIDPGMEPVVQTSRLRLALSSVQTFIQRCFLDLENANNTHTQRNVAPNALDADWWAWMKRYRVWEANREIFLFPENWMEPELRLDKTDLFQTLEGTLLQNDVTSDLADSAFQTYLQGLDVVARLDIVATYLDQNLTHPDISTLHVLGRTYGSPHKYYYRMYSAGTWSMWQAVKPDIDGNHIVLAMWRGRLNIFWLTFATVGLPPTRSSVGGDNTNLNNLSLGSLLDGAFSGTATPQLKVQLNWVEYVVHNGKGKWSDRLSSHINQYNPENPFDIWDQFDVDQDIFVHVSVEVDSQGNEGAVLVHLDIGQYYEADDGSGYAFRVTSKNSNPDFGSKYWQPLYNMPYNADNVDATQYAGSGNLQVGYQSGSDNSGGTWKNDTILSSVNDFSVLNCANVTVPPYMDKSNPFYYQAGALIAPFFYKDRNNGVAGQELTFFVQPSLTETTTVTWNGWAYAPASPGVSWLNPGVIEHINISAQVPNYVPVNPGDPAYGLYTLKQNPDWVTNPATVVSYSGVLIGTDGAVHASIQSSGVVNAMRGSAAGLETGLTASKQIDLPGMAINMSRS